MIIQIVKLKTDLKEEDITAIALERKKQFEAVPGLIQKYYVKTRIPGQYGGIYVWDNAEAMHVYRKSDLAATIAEAYEATEPPEVDLLDILFKLRQET